MFFFTRLLQENLIVFNHPHLQIHWFISTKYFSQENLDNGINSGYLQRDSTIYLTTTDWWAKILLLRYLTEILSLSNTNSKTLAYSIKMSRWKAKWILHVLWAIIPLYYHWAYIYSAAKSVMILSYRNRERDPRGADNAAVHNGFYKLKTCNVQ